MDRFLEIDIEERELIISNVADKKRLSKAIIEKDFWVCWTLDYLFNQFKYKNFVCFKGGTCLSKVYNLIERFSEDIDIALDWTCLGMNNEDAYLERSGRQQQKFNVIANDKTKKYIREVWLPQIKKDFNTKLGDKFSLYIDELDPHTICFAYPQMHKDISILQIIRIEIGVLAEAFPSTNQNVETYISEVYPKLFNQHLINVTAVDSIRTFFEKITILHREAKRTNANYPLRYSRHFYDVFKMIENGIGERALQQLEILEQVVMFKKRFYACNWAEYDNVIKGECLLVPNNEALQIFEEDYQVMKGMIYGEYPSFIEIINLLRQYEEILNAKILESITVNSR